MAMKSSCLIFAAVALVLLAGCTSAIQSGALVVPAQTYGKQHSHTVAVTTAGGVDSVLIRVNDATLAAAIADSLRASKLFSAVVSVGDADYVLNATTVQVDQPMFGGSFTVKTEIAWSLTRKGETKPVWEKLVRSSGTKTMGDAFAGATRMRLATEASTTENIRLAMNEIAALDLR
jgi:hypothetical protein